MLIMKPTEQLLKERGLTRGGRGQKYIDSETIRCMDGYVPFRDGHLKKSVRLGTVIGSGILKYTAPYAKQNYYNNKGLGKQGINNPKLKGLRGRLWFVRMKVTYLDHILNGVSAVIGAKPRRR